MLPLSSSSADDQIAAFSSAKVSRRGRLVALAGLTLYLLVTQLTMGLRVEHLVLGGAFALFVAVGGRLYRFTLLLLPCVATGVSYDYFRLAQGLRGEVHIADLYHAELAWFGIGSEGGRQIPADFLLAHTAPALDLLTGLAYILYLYVPFVCAIALFFIDERRMMQVGLAFFATNLLGMMVYLLYPAAPPWYVAQYGLGPVQLDALPSAAGAARFDELLGVSYFANFYSRSANVFGAMPSLHVAYPAATLLAVAPLGRRWVLPLAAFTLLVGFAAVYLQHHYVLDVLAGLGCAVVGWAFARGVLRRFWPAWRRNEDRPGGGVAC